MLDRSIQHSGGSLSWLNIGILNIPTPGFSADSYFVVITDGKN